MIALLILRKWFLLFITTTGMIKVANAVGGNFVDLINDMEDYEEITMPPTFPPTTTTTPIPTTLSTTTPLPVEEGGTTPGPTTTPAEEGDILGAGDKEKKPKTPNPIIHEYLKSKNPENFPDRKRPLKDCDETELDNIDGSGVNPQQYPHRKRPGYPSSGSEGSLPMNKYPGYPHNPMMDDPLGGGNDLGSSVDDPLGGGLGTPMDGPLGGGSDDPNDCGPDGYPASMGNGDGLGYPPRGVKYPKGRYPHGNYPGQPKYYPGSNSGSDYPYPSTREFPIFSPNYPSSINSWKYPYYNGNNLGVGSGNNFPSKGYGGKPHSMPDNQGVDCEDNPGGPFPGYNGSPNGLGGSPGGHGSRYPNANSPYQNSDNNGGPDSFGGGGGQSSGYPGSDGSGQLGGGDGGPGKPYSINDNPYDCGPDGYPINTPHGYPRNYPGSNYPGGDGSGQLGGGDGGPGNPYSTNGNPYDCGPDGYPINAPHGYPRNYPGSNYPGGDGSGQLGGGDGGPGNPYSTNGNPYDCGPDGYPINAPHGYPRNYPGSNYPGGFGSPSSHGNLGGSGFGSNGGSGYPSSGYAGKPHSMTDNQGNDCDPTDPLNNQMNSYPGGGGNSAYPGNSRGFNSPKDCNYPDGSEHPVGDPGYGRMFKPKKNGNNYPGYSGSSGYPGAGYPGNARRFGPSKDCNYPDGSGHPVGDPGYGRMFKPKKNCNNYPGNSGFNPFRPPFKPKCYPSNTNNYPGSYNPIRKPGCIYPKRKPGCIYPKRKPGCIYPRRKPGCIYPRPPVKCLPKIPTKCLPNLHGNFRNFFPPQPQSPPYVDDQGRVWPGLNFIPSRKKVPKKKPVDESDANIFVSMIDDPIVNMQLDCSQGGKCDDKANKAKAA